MIATSRNRSPDGADYYFVSYWRRPKRSLRRALVGSLATLALAFAMLVGNIVNAPAASAHAELLSSTPTAGASLAAPPPSVRLRFSDPLDPTSVQLAVTNAAGHPVVVGPTLVQGATVDQNLSVTENGPLTVAYRVVSADGHPMQGTLSFTVTAVPGDGDSSGAATSAAKPSEPTSSRPVPSTPAASAVEEKSSGVPVIYWVLGGLVATLVVVSVLVWLRRQRGLGRPSA